MAKTNQFGDKSLKINDSDRIITVTKKTIRFGRDVYQTHNVTGFSEGEVDLGQIPWIPLIFALIIGLGIFQFNNLMGFVFIGIAIAGIVRNLTGSKHYGLLLTLNSGDKELFVTKDMEGLKNVITEIFDFIENQKEKDNIYYQISVTNSHVSGNFIQGNSNRTSF